MIHLKKMRIFSLFRQILPLLAFILFWEIFSFLLGSDKFPRIESITISMLSSFFYDPMINAQGGGSQGISSHILFTFINYTIGLFSGMTIGLSLSIITFQSKTLSFILEPILEVIRVLPPLLIIPFIILIKGPTREAQIIVITTFTSLSVFVYSLNALRNINKNILSLAKILGTNIFKHVYKIQIPAINKELIGGLRVANALGIGVLVVAEYMGSPRGMGRVLKYAESYTAIELIIVDILWVIIMTFVYDGLIVILFRRVLRWAGLNE